MKERTYRKDAFPRIWLSLFILFWQAIGKIKTKFETEADRLAIITPDRFEEAIGIMRDFFVPDEPLCIAYDVKWSEDYYNMVTDVLKSNMSVCLINKESEEMMGVRLMNVVSKSDKPFDLAGISDVPLRELFSFLIQEANVPDMFERFGSDEAAHFFSLAVHSKYRKLGVGSRLLGGAIAMCRELGAKGIKGEGTSSFSQRIYEKEGFETVLTCPYENYKTPSGQSMRETTGVHSNMKVYLLKL